MQFEPDPIDGPQNDIGSFLSFLGSEITGESLLAMPSERVREAAATALDLTHGRGDDGRVALEVLIVEALLAGREQLCADLGAGRHVIEQVQQRFGIHPAVVARGLLRSPDLLTMHPPSAIAAQLAMLMTLAPLEEVSVWWLDDVGGVECMGHAGKPSPEADTAALALRLTRGDGAYDRDGALVAVPVEHAETRLAAVVGRCAPELHQRVRPLMAEATPVIAATLEREQLHARGVEMQRALADSRHRTLTRLGLDVHDGPLQDLAALAQDLALFRSQLAGALAGHEREAVINGRVDDLEAQLVAVDADLRRLAVSLQSPFLVHTDFARGLHETIDGFAVTSGITPQLQLSGDVGFIIESQQLALLAILRESLNNVREHSDAKNVSIVVAVDDDGIHASVTDDGSGFDVETTLIRAARGGHLGLVGMQERMRMLDGQTRIDSRPGGPTAVTVELPRLQPAD